jgi:hypothetical protein
VAIFDLLLLDDDEPPEPRSAGGGYFGDYVAERRTFLKWQAACYLLIEHSFSTAGNKVFSDFRF